MTETKALHRAERPPSPNPLGRGAFRIAGVCDILFRGALTLAKKQRISHAGNAAEMLADPLPRPAREPLLLDRLARFLQRVNVQSLAY